jgi:hypothetical protein
VFILSQMKGQSCLHKCSTVLNCVVVLNCDCHGFGGILWVCWTSEQWKLPQHRCYQNEIQWVAVECEMLHYCVDLLRNDPCIYAETIN